MNIDPKLTVIRTGHEAAALAQRYMVDWPFTYADKAVADIRAELKLLEEQVSTTHTPDLEEVQNLAIRVAAVSLRLAAEASAERERGR